MNIVHQQFVVLRRLCDSQHLAKWHTDTPVVCIYCFMHGFAFVMCSLYVCMCTCLCVHACGLFVCVCVCQCLCELMNACVCIQLPTKSYLSAMLTSEMIFRFVSLSRGLTDLQLYIGNFTIVIFSLAGLWLCQRLRQLTMQLWHSHDKVRPYNDATGEVTTKARARSCMQGAVGRLPGHLPGNRKVPGSMPGQGFLQLLFPWARNFTPIASATQLINREHILCIM